jgi:uncharacterized RDD family membrane protein YckC
MKKSTLAWLLVLLPALSLGLAQARTPKVPAPPAEASAAPAPAAPATAAPTPAAPPDASAPVASPAPAAGSPAEQSADDEDADDPSRSASHRHRHRRSDTDIVNFGGDSNLPQGEHADSVVSILGSSSVEGETGDAVSILGNTRVTGRVHDSAVAILGNTYIDGAVGGDVVAVMGDVELGPNAVVGHDAVAVGGTVHRDSAATVHGNVQSVGGPIGGFDWLHPWVRHCLLYGRPLAFADGVGWAWGLAFMFLGLYMGLAFLFRDAVSRCVETFEARPGMTVVAALLAVLLIPVLFVLLFITVIGIAAIPFVAFGLLCAGLFGKAVMLAWIGRRCLGKHGGQARSHPAMAVLVGGLIVLLLYVIPVLGFLIYKVLGLLGLGAVAYTVIGHARAWRETRAPQAPSGGAPLGAAAAGGAAFAAASAEAAPAGATPAGATPAGTVPAGAAPGGTAPAGTAPAGATPPPAAPAAAAITAAMPRAGFWIRMLALLIDALLIGVLMGILHHVFNMELVMLAVYGAIMWKLRGSTIGGIVFDLQVVRLDGRPIDWETAIVRALGCFLSLVVAGLGFFWIAFDPGRQAWHDKIAGTAVVRVAKGVPLV